MSFTDDARSDEQRIESAAELSAWIERVRKLRAAIVCAAAEQRREAGQPIPRSLGN